LKERERKKERIQCSNVASSFIVEGTITFDERVMSYITNGSGAINGFSATYLTAYVP
jgi:hypothetical protein